MSAPDTSASPEARAELRRVLLKLRKRLRINDALHFGYPRFGICYYADRHSRSPVRAALDEGFAAWPKSNGRLAYPVPSPLSPLGPHRIYKYASVLNALWNVRDREFKEYAALRRELLDFLIDYLK